MLNPEDTVLALVRGCGLIVVSVLAAVPTVAMLVASMPAGKRQRRDMNVSAKPGNRSARYSVGG